ncbi:hypothetical protein AGMMS50293_18110 [Spirochaetia bacterium]|nr:hypothetical protein AGMMS50293_18110 [Spirochaetia bacterium]
MLVVGIIFGLVILAAMVYLAISKKSTPMIRLASLIALGVMITTVIICLFLIFFGTAAPVDESIVIVSDPVNAASRAGGNFLVLLLFVLFLVGLFVTVLVISLKEQRKSAINAVKQKTASLFIDEEPL